MIMNARPTNERINTVMFRGNFLHCSKASYEIIDFFEFSPLGLLANPSHLRYVAYRYGTFPAISDARLARRFLPKLGLHSCGPFFLFNNRNGLAAQGQFGAA